MRVARGGSALSGLVSLWPWYRNGYAPADRGNIIGFRCARAP